MQGWISQLRRGLMEYCVLQVLRRGESYGYRIVQDLRRVEALSVSESTVYPILHRLQRERMLRVRDVPSDEGPSRRYVALTPAGRARAAAMDCYWRELNDAIKMLHQPAHEGGARCEKE